MAAHCAICNRSFGSEDALAQHIRDSPAHIQTFECDTCDRSFGSEDALAQHVRDSPAHIQTFECDTCDRSFGSEDALDQHIRDSPAHNVRCDACDMSFDSRHALSEHVKVSSAHRTFFECDLCNRGFGSPDVLSKHLRSRHRLRDSAHTSLDGFVEPSVEASSTYMYPLLHPQVARATIEHLPSIWWQAEDDEGNLSDKNFATYVRGGFRCQNQSCRSSCWGSGMIAISIRGYAGDGYNAMVFGQRCKFCNYLGIFSLDEQSYIDRVAYRLMKWAGVPMEQPVFQHRTTLPHMNDLCEACRLGVCRQSPS
ncbi:hypothetical protein EJ05DRAFT_472616 [Pseudovirgaria hyperparasitica]|uniref:C2H2-type domain-containing protein n=1 Tax=Pseudovirgaria hyperparasitica TaxID=470096 RepID=A0A6A6WFW4_9PEZI|nr:uncharacterized protein EJ05DRAFT_472616 [Pseudovirgaria hyperparasitica]KAF2761643.1 hypothetical protein EJ05DRAFT_472616 [Pseudovirgaria hyperparasitica]